MRRRNTRTREHLNRQEQGRVERAARRLAAGAAQLGVSGVDEKGEPVVEVKPGRLEHVSERIRGLVAARIEELKP